MIGRRAKTGRRRHSASRHTPSGCYVSRRQVSWLAGRRTCRPSRSFDQWHGWQGLTAYSCGGSHGLGPIRVVLTVFPINPSGLAFRNRPLQIGSDRKPCQGTAGAHASHVGKSTEVLVRQICRFGEVTGLHRVSRCTSRQCLFCGSFPPCRSSIKPIAVAAARQAPSVPIAIRTPRPQRGGFCQFSHGEIFVSPRDG